MQSRSVPCIAVLGFVVLLAACATTYGPLGARGGYYEKALGNDEYEVSFRGNPLIEEKLVREYLLVRCAELTLEKGHQYFIIWADSSFVEDKLTRSTPEQPWTSGSSTINQATANPEVLVDTKQTWVTARFIIQTSAGKDPAHAYAQMDAKTVLAERQHLLK
jgi:hypothetical protein